MPKYGTFAQRSPMFSFSGKPSELFKNIVINNYYVASLIFVIMDGAL